MPYIAFLHGGNLPARLDRSPRMSNDIFFHAYANIAPSGYLKTAFEQRAFKAQLIPNFISIENYHYRESAVLHPNFLWVRSFANTYHPEMTIRVFNEIQKTYPAAQLCMIGDNKDDALANCKKLIIELGLENNILITGGLPKAEWIAIAPQYNIFISTTHFDNTPISIMEAMALGLPVVSTNVGGMPFLIEHGKDGLLSPDNDINAMVENIKTLIESPEITASIRRNARQKVESFDWKVVEKQWLDLLHNAN